MHLSCCKTVHVHRFMPSASATQHIWLRGQRRGHLHTGALRYQRNSTSTPLLSQSQNTRRNVNGIACGSFFTVSCVCKCVQYGVRVVERKLRAITTGQPVKLYAANPPTRDSMCAYYCVRHVRYSSHRERNMCLHNVDVCAFCDTLTHRRRINHTQSYNVVIMLITWRSANDVFIFHACLC